MPWKGFYGMQNSWHDLDQIWTAGNDLSVCRDISKAPEHFMFHICVYTMCINPPMVFSLYCDDVCSILMVKIPISKFALPCVFLLWQMRTMPNIWVFVPIISSTEGKDYMKPDISGNCRVLSEKWWCVRVLGLSGMVGDDSKYKNN
jgi:hypothetical protein